MNCRISIICPVKNAEAHIHRHFQSVLTQTQPPASVIYVGGASTDNTTKIINDCASKSGHIKLIEAPKSNISEAFDLAIEAAEAEYICFLNSDDFLLAEHLEIMQSIIEKQQPDIITSHMYFISGRRKRLILPRFPTDYPIRDWAHPRINHPGMVIKKQLFERVGGFDPGLSVAMDVDFFYRALQTYPRIAVNTEASVFQYDGGVSQTGWHTALSEMKQIEVRHGRNRVTAELTRLFRLIKKRLKFYITLRSR